MARQQHDRENLLVEGVNMPTRGRIVGADSTEWLVGCRRDGAISVFENQDPVFHFNGDGELRRAYVAGQKISVQDGKLVSLVAMARSTGKIANQLVPLTSQKSADLLEKWSVCQNRLLESLPNSSVECVGCEESMYRQRVDECLRQLASTPSIAKLPNVG